MSIVTKSGDQGETSLYSGERVKKTDPRVEAVGVLDELNSNLTGLELEDIQENIFLIGSLVADTRVDAGRVVLEEELKRLEKSIYELENELPPLKNFILPGGHPLACQVHRARAICRRAERRVCEVSGLPKNITPYLNRLSDFLFVLARKINMDTKTDEIIWKVGYSDLPFSS
ncbi:MAG: cob(I)yrinic acid a,c-diamide adenosyltransferase [Candidatus Gracilibacteria bacterium]